MRVVRYALVLDGRSEVENMINHRRRSYRRDNIPAHCTVYVGEPNNEIEDKLFAIRRSSIHIKDRFYWEIGDKAYTGYTVEDEELYGFYKSRDDDKLHITVATGDKDRVKAVYDELPKVKDRVYQFKTPHYLTRIDAKVRRM